MTRCRCCNQVVKTASAERPEWAKVYGPKWGWIRRTQAIVRYTPTASIEVYEDSIVVDCYHDEFNADEFPLYDHNIGVQVVNLLAQDQGGWCDELEATNA